MTMKPIDHLQEALELIDYTFEDAADNVRDVLEAYADLIEEREPYATVTINHLRKAAGSIVDAPDYLTEEDRI